MLNLKSVFGSYILHLAQYVIDIPSKVNNAYRHKYSHKHPMEPIYSRPIAALTNDLLSKSVDGRVKYVEQEVDCDQHQAFADRFCRGICVLQVNACEVYGIINADTDLSSNKTKDY